MSAKRITPEQEYAICLRRGHSVFLTEQWRRCRWCLWWVRETRTKEERKDEPPTEDQDYLSRLERSSEIAIKPAVMAFVKDKAKKKKAK